MMHKEKARSRVAAVVLAAGGSVRMGQPKQLLLIDGQPMVRRVTETVCSAGFAQVVVVLGAQAEKIGHAIRGLPVEIVCNKQWSEGMSGSLRAGLYALRPEIQAALIVPADQPGLSAGLLHSLVARYQATRALIVAPFYRGQRGNPVLWDRALFPSLMALQGDRGGRDLIALNEGHLERVAAEDSAVLQDVDTPGDYQEARAALSQ